MVPVTGFGPRACPILVLLLLAQGCPDWEGLSSGRTDSAAPDRVSPGDATPDLGRDLLPGPDASWCSTATAPSSCPAGVHLCDGFEGGVIDVATWSLKEKLGTLQLDSSCTYRGQGAVAVETSQAPAGQRVAANIIRHDPAVAGMATVHFRAHLFLDATPLLHPTKILMLRQDGTTTKGLRVLVDGGMLALENSLTQETLTTATPMPTGRWTCLELEVSIGSPGTVRVHLDGTPVIDASQDTLATPPLDTVGVGVINLDTVVAQSPIRMWIDEVAVDDQPVGCHP